MPFINKNELSELGGCGNMRSINIGGRVLRAACGSGAAAERRTAATSKLVKVQTKLFFPK